MPALLFHDRHDLSSLPLERSGCDSGVKHKGSYARMHLGESMVKAGSLSARVTMLRCGFGSNMAARSAKNGALPGTRAPKTNNGDHLDSRYIEVQMCSIPVLPPKASHTCEKKG